VKRIVYIIYILFLSKFKLLS